MVADKSNNSLISGAANLASKQLGSGLFDTALSFGKKALSSKFREASITKEIKNGTKFQ